MKYRSLISSLLLLQFLAIGALLVSRTTDAGSTVQFVLSAVIVLFTLFLFVAILLEPAWRAAAWYTLATIVAYIVYLLVTYNLRETAFFMTSVGVMVLTLLTLLVVSQERRKKRRRTRHRVATVKPRRVYMAAKEGSKVHRPSCRMVDRIKKEDRLTFTSFEDAAAQGYTPCKICKPDSQS